ncbi:winged helix-turn-helix domain-containing protein [Chloroflexota bacterium]
MMRVNQRRSDVEIIAEMLRIGANGAGKTKIMYNANMSYFQIEKYLHFLIDQGYLDRKNAGGLSVTYQATGKGLNLMKCIDGFIEILGLDDE